MKERKKEKIPAAAILDQKYHLVLLKWNRDPIQEVDDYILKKFSAIF